MDNGIYRNISFGDYRKIEAVNNSMLTKFSITPAHAKAAMETPCESASMLLGSVFHSLVLEPLDFADNYAIEPNINKCTNAGKEELRAFIEANKGKTVISQAVFDTADLMAKKVLNHPIAKQFLGGESELTIIWETNCIKCKGRIDQKIDGVIVDLKSTHNANPDSFKSSLYRYRYHQQAAFYLDGIKGLTGEDCSFVIIAQENDAPYGTSVFEIDSEVVNLGRQEYLSNLAEYQECITFDVWPCYPEILHKITL